MHLLKDFMFCLFCTNLIQFLDSIAYQGYQSLVLIITCHLLEAATHLPKPVVFPQSNLRKRPQWEKNIVTNQFSLMKLHPKVIHKIVPHICPQVELIYFCLFLLQARQRNQIACNFKGVGIGNGWVSPYHIVSSWPEFLFWMVSFLFFAFIFSLFIPMVYH